MIGIIDLEFSIAVNFYSLIHKHKIYAQGKIVQFKAFPESAAFF